MGHPARCQFRIRGGHGRCAGSLPPAPRSGLSAGLPGRDVETIDRRNTRANRGEARPPASYDYEYERNGTANLFMMFAPLEGWRHVEVTDRHTALDYAHALKELSDQHFPNAKNRPGSGQSQHPQAEAVSL